ncbi:MAG TPA: winged helix DNA-binding domain-containing protein [Nocardioidaceae bacterium]|nr:winged helix DNA-binding domain-containing protein [Nocardioidaceae bacterium]
MLSARVLNRTLLQRQLLLQRSSAEVAAVVDHLVGLQAQDTQPPYVGLWSRLPHFVPDDLTRLVESRQVSRILLMRGTIHLVTAEDCLGLRPLLQGTLERLMRGTPFVWHCEDIAPGDLERAALDVLGPEPLDVKALGTALAERIPGHEPGHLANTARVRLPLVQAPPRGLWKRSGGPAYVHATQWHGTPASPIDAAELVRRYLRAFGPATAADVTTWSGMTGIRAVLGRMKDELVTYNDATGRTLVDLEGLPLAEADVPAPVRLLGKYDNLWLSHADRTRVSEPQKRQRWMGRNGGVGNAVFVDGMLEGLWRQDGDRVEVELFRRLARAERADLDAEVAALEEFLTR